MLQPRSDPTERVETLWWLMLWIAAAVFVVVVALVIAGVVRRSRRHDQIDETPAPWGGPFIAVSGIVLPVLILGIVYVISLQDLAAITHPPEEPQLEIDVVAHNWWWELRYGDDIVTANEIHIPTGQVVELNLATADVIHTFWVPQLQVKKDHIPGMNNTLWLEADEPGRYRGQCAEFCGLQHAHMAFFVVAEEPEDFERWLAAEAAPAERPSGTAAVFGEEVFLSSSCVGCHSIRGTPAQGDLGPDLTHLMRRETLGAGIVPNTLENLTAFVADTQEVKPGAAMPPSELSGAELEALIEYLRQLE